MAKTVGDFLLDRLTAWGVSRIFGYPGDGINGILGAFERAKDRFEFVQVRHEEEAAFMACAHAKFTGDVGVCLATSGPGAIHLLNGLYDAKLDHQPVVAIVGQTPRAAMGSDYQQEVDLFSLFKDVASEYVQICMTPEQMPHLVDRAFRIAVGLRVVTAIIVPNDVQELSAAKPGRQHGAVMSGPGYSPPRVVPQEADLRRAAEVLNAGEKVAILIGAGAMNAAEEVIAVANVLGAGVAKALLGKAALPDDLPFVTGPMGLLGSNASDWMMKNCDTLFMIGSRFPYSEFLPKPESARGVQIDLDPKMLSIRYPMEVSLVGDAATTLVALMPLLKQKTDGAWRKSVQVHVRDWWKDVEKKSLTEADPINPERLVWELSPRLPDNAIVTADSGTSAAWFARALKIRWGMKASLSGTLATMCPAVPYATAAKFAYPDRVAVALVGDGAMQMLGINGLITIAKYWRRWSDPRLVVAVLNNRDLNMVSWELRGLGGSPKIEETQNVPDFRYADFAKMLGLGGRRVERPEDVAPAWEEAFAADRPYVIDCVVDPTVPSLPPHITAKQALNYAKALLKGDPEAAAIAWHTWKVS